MDKITRDEFEGDEIFLPVSDIEPENDISPADSKVLLKDFKKLVKKMDEPVERMKELAAKLKQYIDKRMEEETKQLGYISEYTRKFIADYQEILSKLQKSIHGNRSVNLHMHKVSHSAISSQIRKHMNQEGEDGVDQR